GHRQRNLAGARDCGADLDSLSWFSRRLRRGRVGCSYRLPGKTLDGLRLSNSLPNRSAAGRLRLFAAHCRSQTARSSSFECLDAVPRRHGRRSHWTCSRSTAFWSCRGDWGNSVSDRDRLQAQGALPCCSTSCGVGWLDVSFVPLSARSRPISPLSFPARRTRSAAPFTSCAGTWAVHKQT